MNPTLIVSVLAGYFGLLLLISFATTVKADSKTFFTGNRQSPWFLVAFGMIGTSLSGVTFISVPGWVASTQFGYMQIVLGYLLGYLVIGLILMPLYYRLKLISIYGYLDERFGFWSYKTGALYFLFSRTLGAAFRLYLVANTLQIVLFDSWGIPFSATVIITIVLIWIYTFRGGIKTIVWTDTLQTLFMLSSVGVMVYLVCKELNLDATSAISKIQESEYSQVFFWDWNEGSHFVKQFLSGAFIAIVMTGLDQDMMQKNLTCKSLGDAQKNMFWFSISLVFVNLLFLSLGALLYIYADVKGLSIPERSDELFPILAVTQFGDIAGILFLLGLTAAAYSSADSALTSLTTSFCIDFLDFRREDTRMVEYKQRNLRLLVHLGFSILLIVVILIFREISDQAVISAVFKVAGYTYGPLLGLYAFGLLMKGAVRDHLVPFVCLASPAISYLLDANSAEWFNGFEFGFFILIVNGAITFLGLALILRRSSTNGG